jgi:hypothetical protein
MNDTAIRTVTVPTTEDYAVRAAGKGAGDVCIVCGHTMRGTVGKRGALAVWMSPSDVDQAIHPEDVTAFNQSAYEVADLYPIGIDCAKRLPVDYIVRCN